MSKLLLLIICLTLFFSGCKQNTTDTKTITGTPGSIVGYVQKQSTDSNFSDQSGVKINLIGTNYTAITDIQGRWEIKELPPGTYDIFYSSIGFDTTIIYGFPFTGNGAALVLPEMSATGGNIFQSRGQTFVPIYKIPDCKLLNLSWDNKLYIDSIFYDSSNGMKVFTGLDTSIIISGTLNRLHSSYYVSILYGETESISLTNNIKVLYFDYIVIADTMKLKIPKQDLRTKGLLSKKIYISTIIGQYNAYETDIRNGTTRYLGHPELSNVTSFFVE